MGTRHYQSVITKEGDVKLRQYGQWDGYPSGQGVEILEFLRASNLEEYQRQIYALREITEEEAEGVDKDPDWDTKYPYLSRDCGSKIHQMILYGKVKFVVHTPQEDADKWCEGFYTIDFNRGVFTSEYHGVVVEFSIDSLPSNEEYIDSFTKKDLQP